MSPQPLDPEVIAADYLVAALGVDRARLVTLCLQAGWLTETERKSLEPLVVAIDYLIGDRRAYIERQP